jgi:hypothetical protein
LLCSVSQPAQAKMVRCGMSQGRWNAPQASLVVTRSPGVVQQIFAVGGQYFTHVMVSHGSGWMSHAHRSNPIRNSDFDAIFGRPLATSPTTLPGGNPLSTLKAGQPGASSLGMGGTYVSIYGDGAGAGPQVALYKTGNAQANEVERYVWNMPLRAIHNADGSINAQAYQLMNRRTLLGTTVDTPIPYSFFQFKSIGTNHRGTISPDGVACSTFLSWAVNRATGNTMTPLVLPETTVRTALQVAHDATRDQCHSALEEEGEFVHFMGNLGNACDKAGNQIADCMAGTNGGKCDNYGDEYTRPSEWGGGRTAQVISPDRLVGYSSVDTASPWSSGGMSQWGVLQWSGTPVYGCWVSDDNYQD